MPGGTCRGMWGWSRRRYFLLASFSKALQLQSSWTCCFPQLAALIPGLATGSYTGVVGYLMSWGEQLQLSDSGCPCWTHLHPMRLLS